ncbi:MAG TPA: hypothetical protein VGA95_07100 [Thermodesulfobacteriota bacterium]
MRDIGSRTLNLIMLNITLASLIFLSGCDIEFGGGGGGDGGDSFETVQGTVTSIVPNTIPVEGTIVTVNENPELSATLPSSGFFMIEGLFSGQSVRLTFSEQEDSSPFAQTFLNVYRGATLELGTINIENGNVIFTGSIVTNFDGTVLQNDCDVNSGTLEVQTRNTKPEVFVIVNITPTTDITGCRNEPCFCEDIGTKVKVRGILESSNVVTAGTLTIK